jgi:drug/metabolite transporter (DMT)-like permease
MTHLVLGLILLTVTLSACAQLVLKLGVAKPLMEKALRGSIADALFAALSSPLIWSGLLIYGLSVAMWLWVLSKVDLSVAYPFVGVSFLITMAFGALLLDESVTPLRIVGTLLITGGCVLVGRSA